MSTPLPVGRIVSGDLLKVLPRWPAESVDLVFADPPFNIGYKYDKYRDDLAPLAYINWTKDWLDACLRVLKPAGSMWVAIGDEYAAEVRVMMRKRATLRNWVIWRYTFGQSCKGKFNRSHAHLLYFVKDPKKFTFNADAVRVPSDRQLKYDDARANPKGKLPDDVWTYSRVCGTFRERVGWHPCQMPVSLLVRIVAACSSPDDVVLDPFAGSGTTLVAAAQLRRQWVGVELSEHYAKRAEERVKTDGATPWQSPPPPTPLVKHKRHGPYRPRKPAPNAPPTDDAATGT
jgi:site-specific DNA-methyltransferase (adenine-specific)